MSFRAEDLIEYPDIQESLFDHIQQVWNQKNADADIKGMMYENLEKAKVKKGKAQAFFDGESLVGMVYYEKVTSNYGYMLLHDLDPFYRRDMCKHLVKAGLTKDMLLEVTDFYGTSDYLNHFISLGGLDNHRQRMALWLIEHQLSPIDFGDGYRIEPLTPALFEPACRVYAAGHTISDDYNGFYDLKTFDRRYEMEIEIYNDLYGPYDKEASLALFHNNVLVGACSIVAIKTWGHDQVPWVYDIAIAPEHHGKGLGTKLMQQSMYILKQKGFELMGLAVTMNNHNAKHIYNKLGFFIVDEFHEVAFMRETA